MTAPSHSSTASASSTGPWHAFTVLASIEFLTVMDASVVNIALPAIRGDLGLAAADASWVVNAYLITFAGLLLAAGRLADTIGRRQLFITGTVIFTTASALCGVSTESWHLLTGRAIQGVGAALVMPSAIALIGTVFPAGPRRVRAFGIFSGMAGVAAPIGLAAGGLLTTVDWHLIFWINVPIGLAVTIAAVAWLPSPARTANQVDALAALSATATLALLCYAAISSERNGLTTPPTLIAAAAAVATAGTLATRQRLARHPLLPPQVLGAPGLLLGNAIFALVGTSLLGTFYFITLYLQQVRDLGPTHAVFAYLPVPLAMLAGTQLAPRAIERYTMRDALGIGLILQSAGLGLWVLLSGERTELITTHLIPVMVWSVGLGIAIVSSFVACTASAPDETAGAASGLATSAYQGGGAIGLALVAALAAKKAPPTGASHVTIAELTGYHWAMGALAGLTAVAAAMSRALPRKDAQQKEPDATHG